MLVDGVYDVNEHLISTIYRLGVSRICVGNRGLSTALAIKAVETSTAALSGPPIFCLATFVPLGFFNCALTHFWFT